MRFEGVDPRKRQWWVPESVELVNDPTDGPALLFSPRPTAREMFPGWYLDYDPPRRPDGSPIWPHEKAYLEQPGEIDDRMVFAEFVQLLGGRGAPTTPEEFAEKRGERALMFAKRYGALGIGAEREAWQNPEPLADWWAWGRSFQAAVTASAALASGQLPSRQDWYFLTGTQPRSQATCRTDLQRALQYWIDHSGFRNRVKLATDPKDNDVRTLDPATSEWPLFAALVRRTVFQCTGVSGLWRCDECGVLHARRRAPTAGGRKYCPDCGKTAPARHHARRSRSAG